MNIDFVKDYTTVIERVDEMVYAITICPNGELITLEYSVEQLLFLTNTVEDNEGPTVNTHVVARLHMNVLNQLRKRGVNC